MQMETMGKDGNHGSDGNVTDFQLKFRKTFKAKHTQVR